jgi:hypothetical protein
VSDCPSFIRSTLTAADNLSGDLTKLLTVFAVFATSLIEGFDVLWRNAHFDPIQFAAALGGLVFGGAAGQRIKAGTEPGDASR